MSTQQDTSAVSAQEALLRRMAIEKAKLLAKEAKKEDKFWEHEQRDYVYGQDEGESQSIVNSYED